MLSKIKKRRESNMKKDEEREVLMREITATLAGASLEDLRFIYSYLIAA